MSTLTPEEMARIEEQERKRLAEETYRQAVRARLERSEPLPPGRQKEAVRSNARFKASVAVVAFSLMSGVLVYLFKPNPEITKARRAAMAAVKSPRYVSKIDQIVSGRLVVRHGGSVHYRIVITPEMRNPVVSGNFEASGGRGNDIAGVLADENEYENWINGHACRVYWSTQGNQTTGNFEKYLTPGTYYLAFSNKFSAFTDKDVSLSASVRYEQLDGN